MGVLLQGFSKLPPNRAVPSPVDGDGDSSVQWWWDHLASQANDLRKAGFTAVWLPPVLKTNSGSSPGADGYGPFDDYDIGSKDQQSSLPTRFGTREQLQRCVAVMRANGLDVYLDLVEHQRIGDPGNSVFRYRGADGTPNIGRFPKDPSNFRPPQDPHLGGPPTDDIPFGRELAPINGKPPHYVFDNLIAAADWLTRALDVQGYRIDDVKGISTDFLLPFLNSKSMAGKFAVGEFFDGNRLLVNGWVFNPHGMQCRTSAFDFPLKFMLSSMCNNPGRFNMADLDHAGLTGIAPLNAVTFVENHDTDLHPSQSAVVLNKILAYAYILTSEGYPCVYYRDYSTDKDCYGLKPLLDNLIWIHEHLAFGPTEQRWKSFNVFAYERLGGPHLLVGLNNDPANTQQITVATGFGSNVTLHDYSGHAGNVVTDGSGAVTITIPKNINGLGYVCYSREGIDRPFVTTSHPVTQDFEGAIDLDILPAIGGKTISVGRIWCAADSPIKAIFKPDKSLWITTTKLVVDLLGPDDTVLKSQAFDTNTPPDTVMETTATATGFHSLRLTATNTPVGNPNPSYKLTMTFTASQTLPETLGAVQAPSVKGQWQEPFNLPNVGIHAHVLPNGKVLFWGRRKDPTSLVFDTLNEHECFPFVWDPVSKSTTETPQPPLGSNPLPIPKPDDKVNLFCSGHTFLPDGRLLVVGGHWLDSHGLNQATIYDYRTNTWTPTAPMGPSLDFCRWYPTSVTLSDGTALVLSGSTTAGTAINTHVQIWNDGKWDTLVQTFELPDKIDALIEKNQNFIVNALYPRLHLGLDGRVFMSGPLALSFFLDTTKGTWTPSAKRDNALSDYAPSVMYDEGKIIYIGGGNPPTKAAEVINLKDASPAWHGTEDMKFPRRQHNATLLPDGTVLVTGGTQGGNGPTMGFNDLSKDQPVHVAELWDPATGKWTQLAAEAVDRCYHSTAVLLPDATVLSAGGGEYQPTAKLNPNTGKPDPNDPKDSHREAQIFFPPYLFKGPRPDILTFPDEVTYGETFEVVTSKPGEIGHVSWIRLPSVTHSFDQNQRINFLAFSINQQKLMVTTPPNPNVCPPGHYMLFLLNKAKVPSVAKIIKISGPLVPALARPLAENLATSVGQSATEIHNQFITDADKGTFVEVGLTATCPYGLGACWGGAYEALKQMQAVKFVRPIANVADSTASVYLSHDGLPDIEQWPNQFARTAHSSYVFRGIEVTLTGTVERQNGHLFLQGNDVRPAISLMPLEGTDKIQWDRSTGSPKPLEEDERLAYQLLAANVQNTDASPYQVQVTGPLKKNEAGFELYVRKFQGQQAR